MNNALFQIKVRESELWDLIELAHQSGDSEERKQDIQSELYRNAIDRYLMGDSEERKVALDDMDLLGRKSKYPFEYTFKLNQPEDKE
ncbi:hypothetical protein HOD75_04665 [archaeon]|nr:hypothetical protein [archaeon]MBT4242157.1 hypothetical protein [archaeon]MBT4417845.1 hypothetical protein [archaeon]